MQRFRKLLATSAALCFGGLVLAPGINAQTMTGEARSLLAQSQAGPKSPAATAIPPVAPEPPIFLSDEWKKREQLTEDRLRKLMTICKGC